MAEQKRNRPVPKRRSVYSGGTVDENEGFSTVDMYGRQGAQNNTGMSSDSCPGLPNCVQLKSIDVSSSQRSKDSDLPRLLHQLDEACKKYQNDAEKSAVAILCLKAASSPIRKYRILQFFKLLESNKNNIQKLPGALSILEKYASNLLREEKPPQWKEIKCSTSIIKTMLLPVQGALDVLKQMGYTEETRSALTFPSHVQEPNISTIIVLTADLNIARHEVDALINKRHPFLIFNLSGTMVNTPEVSISAGGAAGSYVSGFCGVCSEQNLAKSCAECDMQFCQECDQRWHLHKLRKSHVRTALTSTNKGHEEKARRRPVPVPRPRKGLKAGPSNVGSSEDFQEPPTERSTDTYGTPSSKHFPHSASATEEIKRPPQYGNVTSPGNLTSPGNVTSPGNMRSPDSMRSPGNMASPGNMMSPGNMTYPGNRTYPGSMTSPGNVTYPSNMTSYGNMRPDGNVTSPDNWNIHINPSQQHQIFSNPTYSTPQPNYSPQNFNQSGSGSQNFSQSGSTYENFNRSGSSPQNFNPSGGRVQDSNQSHPRDIHRVLSCPNCSLLYPEAEQRCPSCNLFLSSNSEKSSEAMFNPSGVAQQGLNLNAAASKLPTYMNYQDEQQTLLAKSKELARRKLPDVPCGQDMATRDNHVNNAEAVYEDVDEMLEWICEHCTFMNPLGTKVCQVCYKTPSDLKKLPNIVQKSAASTPKPKTPASNERTLGSQLDPMGPFGTQQDQNAVFMTPKDRPLEGGIFRSRNEGEAPPLPAKNAPGGKVRNAQKLREEELTEKEMGKRFYEEKQEMLNKGLLRDDEIYTIDSREQLLQIVEARRRMKDSMFRPGQGYPVVSPENDHDQQLLQLLQSGLINDQDLINSGVPRPNVDPITTQPRSRDVNQFSAQQDAVNLEDKRQPGNTGLYQAPTRRQNENKDDLALSEDQLQQLLKEGVFLDNNPVLPPPPQHFTQVNPDNTVTDEDRYRLYQAGFISLNYLQNSQPADYRPTYDVPTADRTYVNQADLQSIQSMFEDFKASEGSSDPRQNNDRSKQGPYYNFNVTRDAPVIHDIYAKRSRPWTSMPAQNSKGNFSSYLNSQSPFENLSRRNFIDDQSRQYVEWIKEAEKYGFTPEELNLANNVNWQDSKGRSPVKWLRDEWSGLVANVIGRVTEQTSNENDHIGNLSTDEAKRALIENLGSVESACKACIESRREKLVKMTEGSMFTKVDCVYALDRNNGNLKKALLELEIKAMEPIRKRVLGLQDQEDNVARSSSSYEEIARNKDVSPERRVRVVFIEKKMLSWGRAETAVRLIDMGFDVEDCVEAANGFGDLERSLRYLQQECPLCLEQMSMGKMITFLSCQDKICKDCVTQHLTVCIKDKQLHQLVCPVCGKPDDLNNEAVAAEYFNNLDYIIREFLDREVHDVFQKKLRDRGLRKEENFRWCAHCSYGFINEQPNVNKMQCPSCLEFTCFSCKKQWKDQHEGITCEQFAQWQIENDEEYQLAGLAGHLARNGIDCPNCKFRYDLARGGCMHFKCGQCGHEFCSGCYNPFKHGGRCNVFASCARKGIHAHHPRDCLFYLRDWTPVRLQALLRENGVDYKAGARGLAVQDEEGGSEDDEELVGAVGGGGVQNCKVMEQKDAGMEDVECGRVCEPDHDGLCKMHYTEYLVDLINKNGIDPAVKMSIDEILVVYQRTEIQPSPRGSGGDDHYREQLIEEIKRTIPLPPPPGAGYAAVELQEEDDE